MSRTVRRNVLVSEGNLPVYPAGQPVWADPPYYGGKAQLLVAPGQYVVYNPATGLSVGAGITKAAAPELVFAVGVDTNHDGAADVLRKNTGDEIAGCGLDYLRAQPARCGNPAIKDLYFKCVKCADTYSVEVRLHNNETEGFADRNRGFSYIFSTTIDCNDCGEDCPQTDAGCEALACGLIRAINGGRGSGWDILANGVPIGFQELPFTAGLLYNGPTTYQAYCLTATDGDCVNCESVPSIVQIDIGEDTYELENTTTPGDLTTTPVGYLERVVQLINQAFADHFEAQSGTALAFPGTGPGWASITKSTGVAGPLGACCAYRLEIHSCEDVVLYTNDGEETPVVIQPCDGPESPFVDVPILGACPLCDYVGGVNTFTCGIRITAKETKLPCECFPANRTKADLFTDIEVYPIAGFSDFGGSHVRTVQAPTLPEGTGYLWESKEQQWMRLGGSGYNYVQGGVKSGRIPLPNDKDKLTQGLVKCDESYCVFSIGHHRRGQRHTNFAGDVYAPRLETYLLVPDRDTVTKAELQTILNDYFAAGDCAVPDVSCVNNTGGGQLNDYN